MEQILKNKIPGLFRLISIDKIPNSEPLEWKSGQHFIKYVELSYRTDKSPVFFIKNTILDLTTEYRELNISKILSSDDKINFEVNESFYTEEQIKKIELLRKNRKLENSNRCILQNCKIEWSNKFKLGDRVYYKGDIGIITYKHNMKSPDSPQEWTVRSNGVEYRYVSGSSLKIHEKVDLSYIEVDKELDKLPTSKLLKMYKKSLKVGKGVGNRRIKRVLYEREDLTNKNPSKIVNVR